MSKKIERDRPRDQPSLGIISRSTMPSSSAQTRPQTENTKSTFSEVIDADHTTINQYAARLMATTISDLPLRAHLREQITWLLIRHDVSEDLVMRPAFIKHLPKDNEGESISSQDQDDHRRAKIELLALYHLPLDHPEFMPKARNLFRELAEHMRIESGGQIPRLERALSLEESQRLGSEYLRTQVLKPDLVLNERPVWKDLKDYVETELERFKEVLHLVESEEQAKDGGGKQDQYGKGEIMMVTMRFLSLPRI